MEFGVRGWDPYEALELHEILAETAQIYFTNASLLLNDQTVWEFLLTYTLFRQLSLGFAPRVRVWYPDKALELCRIRGHRTRLHSRVF